MRTFLRAATKLCNFHYTINVSSLTELYQYIDKKEDRLVMINVPLFPQAFQISSGDITDNVLSIDILDQ